MEETIEYLLYELNEVAGGLDPDTFSLMDVMELQGLVHRLSETLLRNSDPSANPYYDYPEEEDWDIPTGRDVLTWDVED